MLTRFGAALLVMLTACDGGNDAATLVAVGIGGNGSAITSLDFGTVAAAESATQMFVVQNQGNGGSGALTVTTSTATPFSVSAGNCELALSPGDTCMESVLFVPTSNTSFTGTVTVTGSNGSISLALTGSGGPHS